MSMLGSFEQASNAFLLDRRIAGLTPATLATYKVHLDLFERWCRKNNIAFEDLTVNKVRAFLAERQNKSQMRLVESYRRLRPFFRWAAQEQIIDDLFATIPKPKEPKPMITALQPQQVRLLLDLCKPRGWIGIRDAALIRVLVDSGIRASEAITLRIEDLCLKDGTAVVRRGKGQKGRLVYLGPRTCRALLQYVNLRKSVDSTLFSTRYGHPLTRRHIHKLIQRLGHKAGIMGARVSPHTLRHSFATWFLRGGGDVFSLQRQLGHSSLSMTRRYVDLLQDDVARAHARNSPGNQL